jgi:hypothetical protein
MTMKTTTKKILWQIAFALFVLVVYGFVAYKLANFDHYGDLIDCWRHLTFKKSLGLLAVLALVPFNIVVEAQRWRTAMRGSERFGIRSAVKDVLAGWAAALLTPMRIGEIPGRAISVDKEHRWQALTAASLCALMLTLVIVSIGLWPTIIWGQLPQNDNNYYSAICIAIVLLWLLFRPICKFINRRTRFQWLKKMTEAGAEISPKDYLKTLALTIVRYGVFCIQLFLMIRVVGVVLTVDDAIICIPTYYLLVTITPSVSLADPGVRGAWAAVVFAAITNDTHLCVLAAVMLWMLNNFLPMMLLPILKKRD